MTIYRLALGNSSNIKSVGSGVHEARIFFGPGYRFYFGFDGEQIILLLNGGSKSRQQSDIQIAKELWAEYKHAKRSKPWR